MAQGGTAEDLGSRGKAAKVSRERILEAALGEFAENGYEGATTASVARRVSVTQPLIHYHFGSKEALWRSAVELAFSRMRSVLQGVEEDVEHIQPSQTVAVLIRRFVYFNAQHPEVARLILSESGTPGSRLRWMAEQHIRPLFRQLEELLSNASRNGGVKDLPLMQVLFAFLGAAPHLFHSQALVQTLYGTDPLDAAEVERQADTLVEIFSHGLVPDSPTGGTPVTD